MKKIFLTLLSFATIATAANAQIAIAPELGLNMANMTFKPSVSPSPSMKAGLAVGAVVDVPFSDHLYLQPGLFYMMNGTSFSGGSYNINTIEIPINLEYKLGKPGSGRFFFGVGPYIGYNISGTAKYGGTSNSIDIGSDSTDGIKALDFGIGLNVGYLLANHFYARLRYQMGLSNLEPQGDANNSIKSSSFGVSIGYYFGGKKHAKKSATKKK